MKEHNKVVLIYFIGIIPLSKIPGTTLLAPDVLKALQEFFGNINAPFKMFVNMDTSSVNSGQKEELKVYFEYNADTPVTNLLHVLKTLSMTFDLLKKSTYF